MDLSNEERPTLEYISINRMKIRKAIFNIKNGAAPGPDGIGPEILKTFCDQLLEPLENIYKDSIDTSIFPSIWKPGHVVPVKKPGKSKSYAESFRPVSLTSMLGKVLESIIVNEMKKFLEDNHLLTDSQHGFRSNRSCISQLLEHCEMILNTLENDKNIDVVYLDYKKAFDKADHSIILRRLREKGIGGKIGKWIQNYLEDRSQSVIANNHISNNVKVISGVPQGSVIGPILFLVLIDNISDISMKSSLGIFADDSRISREINS